MCSHITSIALLLLSLTAGTWLLYKTKKETLGIFFKLVAWLVIIVSFCSIVCCSVCCAKRCCKANQQCSEMSSGECGMNKKCCKEGKEGCEGEEMGCCKKGEKTCEKKEEITKDSVVVKE